VTNVSLKNEYSGHILCGIQALNNLAVTDDNKVKIVEAGALTHYVKLLSPERDESAQTAAIQGIGILASSCKDSNLEEAGCLDG